MSKEKTLDPFIPAIFRGSTGGKDRKSPQEMGLQRITPEALRVGSKVYLRRESTTSEAGERYFPCTVVEQNGKLAISTDENTPSWPPGHGRDHPPGFVMDLEGIMDSLFVKVEGAK